MHTHRIHFPWSKWAKRISNQTTKPQERFNFLHQLTIHIWQLQGALVVSWISWSAKDAWWCWFDSKGFQYLQLECVRNGGVGRVGWKNSHWDGIKSWTVHGWKYLKLDGKGIQRKRRYVKRLGAFWRAWSHLFEHLVWTKYQGSSFLRVNCHNSPHQADFFRQWSMTNLLA